MTSIFVEKPDPLELRLRTSGWGQVRVWLPVLLAVLVIVTESTTTFSSEHTSSWLRPIFEKLFGSFQNASWNRVHLLIRKTGHFCGYAVVCLTFLRAWLLEIGGVVDLSHVSWRQRSCALAVLCTAAVASLDEWHQTYLPSRTGKASDVALDTCGAILSCGLVWIFFWRTRRSRRRPR